MNFPAFFARVPVIRVHDGLAELPLEMRFTRLDNGHSLDVRADLSTVPAAPGTFELLPRCISGLASSEEREEFARLWQQRVERILLEHWEDDAVFQFRR